MDVERTSAGTDARVPQCRSARLVSTCTHTCLQGLTLVSRPMIPSSLTSLPIRYQAPGPPGSPAHPQTPSPSAPHHLQPLACASSEPVSLLCQPHPHTQAQTQVSGPEVSLFLRGRCPCSQAVGLGLALPGFLLETWGSQPPARNPPGPPADTTFPAGRDSELVERGRPHGSGRGEGQAPGRKPRALQEGEDLRAQPQGGWAPG